MMGAIEDADAASECWPEGAPARLSAEDRAEIEELFARYAWGLDLADEDQVLETFADDAIFDHLWQGQADGHEAIKKSLHSLWYDRPSWWYGRQHLFNHFIMDPRPEGVRVRCFFQIVQFNVDYGTNFVFGIGTRDDRVVRRNGRWKFYKIHVNAWTKAEQVPWKGENKIVPRPIYDMAPADTRPFNVQTRDKW